MNKIIQKLLLIVLLLSAMVLPVSAYVDIVEQDESYFVTDEAKMLDSSTEEYIVSKNQVLNETSGASIVIVTVKLLNADIVDYAYTVFNEWQLGDESLNNGILLLVSLGDQDYYCMVGRGLESSFQADEIQSILDDYLEPDFAIGQYQQGIRKVFDAFYQKCTQLYNIKENELHSGVQKVFSSVTVVFEIMQMIFVLFVVMTIVVLVLASGTRRRVVRHRPVVPPPVVPVRPMYHRPVYVHRPSHPRTHRPVSTSSTFRSSGSSMSSRSSFSPRSGGSTRGAGAGRRR